MWDGLLDEPELREFLRALLDLAVRVAAATSGAVFLKDDQRNGLVIQPEAVHGVLLLDPGDGRLLRPRIQNAAPWQRERRKKPDAECLPFCVLRAGRPCLCRDLENDPLYAPLFHDSRSGVAVPIVSASQISGILLLESDRVDAFTSEQVSRLRELGKVAHLRLLNSYLYESTRAQGRPILLIGIERETLEAAFRAAAYDVPILIRGETGSGKEMLARAIHARSPRGGGPLETLNCGTLRGDLVLSHLFGHVRGAFTDASVDHPGILAVADGGTLFLDEIEKMPLESQVLLLRVIESQEFCPVGAADKKRKVNVRFIAATNADLDREMKIGNFLPDLFYRIAGFGIDLSPLRRRRHSIPRLVAWTLDALARRNRTAPKSITDAAMARLQEYPYPGNVRELQNLVTQAFILDRDDRIDFDDLPPVLRASPSVETPPRGDGTSLRRIEAALLSTRGNVRQAARLCGVSRSRLYALMQGLGIEPETYRGE